jgi:hypothetical protein
MFPDNNWYGHRSILLKYLGLKDRNVYAWIQHGWASQSFKKFLSGNKKKIVPLLFWSKNNQSYYKNIGKSYSIGAPFLYLCEMLNVDTNLKKSISKGTLVFPIHSSQDYPQNPDHELLIKKVENISPGPYTACFYYYDFTKKNISIYKKNKWRVVCCVKSRTYLRSLYGLYKEINRHKFVISSGFSSAIIFSMYLKKQTKVILAKEIVKDEHWESLVKFYKNKCPELFNSFLSSKKGYQLAKKELGFHCMQEKDKLIKILGLNSFIKKFLSNIFAKLYDLKYGSGLRMGKSLTKVQLELYKKTVRKNLTY